MDPAQAFEAREIERNKYINEAIAPGDSRIQQFYADAVVLVTGASGFLGKGLVEKLFRSCRIKKLYVLLRTKKKEKTIQEKWARVLEDPVFNYLKETQPDFVDKIVLVEGNITSPGLGINEKDRNAITEEVSIIFHGAATVAFSDPLKKAVMTNVHGTREVILLAKDCKKLRSLVHTSTAYSHTNEKNKLVVEQFYETPISPDTLIQMVQAIDETTLDAITPQLLKPWPNTYSMTKAAAEELVRIMAADLPACIVRPAIVIAAYREPLPGWNDKSCVFGATGIVLGAGLGVLHALPTKGEISLDIIPVDMVNNATIAAAEETVTRRSRGFHDIRIYNVCSSTRNGITFGQVVKEIEENRRLPSIVCVWYGYAFLTPNRLLYNVLYFMLHICPALLVDGLLLLCGRKAILVNVYKKAYKLLDAVSFFLTIHWSFTDSNLLELQSNLSSADRTIFNFDIESIEWKKTITLWCLGIRKYIVKDGLKDTEKALRRQRIFYILNLIVAAIYAYLTYLIICTIFRVVHYVFF